MTRPPRAEPIPLAVITKTHGLKGEFRAVPLSGESENLGKLRRVYVGREGEEPRLYDVERSHSPSAAFYIIKLSGVDDIDAAKDLAGANILADPQNIAPLGDNEFYWHELAGLRVIAANGADLGIVESLFATGSNDVLVVRDGARIRYIPYTDQAVAGVDLAAGVLRLTGQPGLEDL